MEPGQLLLLSFLLVDCVLEEFGFGFSLDNSRELEALVDNRALGLRGWVRDKH